MKFISIFSTKYNTNIFNFTLLFLRIFAGGFMLIHGFTKINNFETISSTFPDPLHISTNISLSLIIFAEVVCSFLIILGFFTRLATIPQIFGMIVAASVINNPNSFLSIELPFIYIILNIIILLLGAGKFSIDELLFSRKKIKLNVSKK
ncbi:MAG: DoxX family protein [Bacteroidales bacterium]|jgi:putative oxidoreductase|nr:DoxX family protein [Bacteroidales bacterium]